MSEPRTAPDNETWDEMKRRTGDSMPRHDIGCTCWPHVSERDAQEAVEAVALAEYRDGRRARAFSPDSEALRAVVQRYVDSQLCSCNDEPDCPDRLFREQARAALTLEGAVDDPANA
jgi:hypothetical protein